MTRYHFVVDALTGESSEVPFSSEEEAAADAAAAEKPPLEAWRVWTIADVSGLNIPAGIDASAADGTTKAIARNQWKAPPGGFFTRANPLFSNAAFLTAFSKTSDDIDALWDAAEALPAPT